MPISIDGTGTITGLSAGGLPDLSITTADIADSAITTAKIAAGAVVPADLSQPMTSGTAVATTSGTAVDFTGIPSWVKRVTVMLNGVSSNGVSTTLLRIGSSSGIESSGYVSGAVYSPSGSNVYITSSSGYVIPTGSASAVNSGIIQLCHIGSNAWAYSLNSVNTGESGASTGGGAKTISSGVLDRVRLTTANGTDTFDAGTVNIMYE